MKTVAVIGAGISGLAAAHVLSRRHHVHLFERERRLGGHTNTVLIEGPTGTVPLDTGFLVHNDRTYPNLVRLFGQLGVATRNSDMSFAGRAGGAGSSTAAAAPTGSSRSAKT
jgi:predicted NAD/FAD-binding protein